MSCVVVVSLAQSEKWVVDIVVAKGCLIVRVYQIWFLVVDSS